MALNDDALTTLQAARQYMRIDGETSTDEDAAIERMINGVSRAIRRHTGRQFLPKAPLQDSDPEVTLEFAYDGSGYLSLAPHGDLRSASAITLSAPPGAAWCSLGAYLLQPVGATLEGTYTWIEGLPVFRSYSLYGSTQPVQAAKIRITGRFGAGVVPADIEGYCLLEVDRRWTNPEGEEQATAGPFSFSDSPGSLSDETLEGLENYRAPTLG